MIRLNNAKTLASVALCMFLIIAGTARVGALENRIAQTQVCQNQKVCSLPPPRAPHLIWPTNLRDPGISADYIIITPDRLYTEAAAQLRNLAFHRIWTNGFDVAIVNLRFIDEQFNQVQGLDWRIRSFMAYAYDNWRGYHYPIHPTYLLLVGDGDHDPNHPEELNDPTNNIPPHIIPYDDEDHEVPTDYFYVCVDDDTGDHIIDDCDRTPDMFLGRLPVDSAGELQNILDKIIFYEATGADPWKTDVTLWCTFVEPHIYSYQAATWGSFEYIHSLLENQSTFHFKEAGLLWDPNNHNGLPLPDFASMYSNDTGGYAEMIADFLGSNEPGDPRAGVINEGRGITILNGHGLPRGIHMATSDTFFVNRELHVDDPDLPGFANWDMPTFIVAESCSTAKYDRLDEFGRDSIGEELLTVPSRGAIAYLGLSCIGGGDMIAGDVFRALLTEHLTTLGQIMARVWLDHIPNGFEVPYSWNLLGDPALRLASVEYEDGLPDAAFASGRIVHQQGQYSFVGAVTNLTHKEWRNRITVDIYSGHPDYGGSRIASCTTYLPPMLLKNELTIPLGSLPYAAPIYALLDSNNEINEENEANNLLTLVDEPEEVSVVSIQGIESVLP